VALMISVAIIMFGYAVVKGMLSGIF